MPSYPPVSPLTSSYFTIWAFFDVLFGQSRETIGTCMLTIANVVVGSPVWLKEVLGSMQRSTQSRRPGQRWSPIQMRYADKRIHFHFNAYIYSSQSQQRPPWRSRLDQDRDEETPLRSGRSTAYRDGHH
jgi:hypothetical protein